MIINALSVDVEEYYNGVEFETALSSGQLAQLPSRVEPSVERVLELLVRTDVRATFFIVGQIATAHPAMVRQIVAAGHEVACHSNRHILVSRQSPQQFRADIQRSKAVLEALSGQPVVGYRAPNYSIGPDQEWAYDLLLEAGFQYDSSIYPILHDRYGQLHAPRFPYAILRQGQHQLIEFPIGTVRLFGMNLPIGGGGYFRLLPGSWIQRGIRHVNRREKRPVMFYFHPWELDPDQPRPAMPCHHRFRHYVNLERMASKLQRLLQQIRFAPASQVLALPSAIS